MADENKNVEISIKDKANTDLTGTTLAWPGTETDEDGVSEWIVPSILGYTPTPTRLSERHETWTVQFNCYARTGPAGETLHRVWELADLVLGAFDQLTLAVKNWAVADPKPTLFYIRFTEGSVTKIEPPAEAGKFTQQLNVSFDAVVIT